MSRKGNKSPFVFNYSIADTTERSLKNNAVHCIYDDQVDVVENYIGAWTVDQYFIDHPAKRYHTKDYFTNGYRVASGFVFLLGVVGDKDQMEALVDNAITTFIVCNSPFQKHILDHLMSIYSGDKLRVIYHVGSTIPELVGRLFTKKKLPPLIDHLTEIKKSPSKYKLFTSTMMGLPRSFKTFDDLNNNVLDLDIFVTASKARREKATEYWGVIQKDLDIELSYFDISELSIPVIKINQPGLKEDIAERLLTHLDVPVAGVVYSSHSNTRVHLRTSDTSVNLDRLSNAFGGTSQGHQCSFTMEAVNIEDLF